MVRTEEIPDNEYLGSGWSFPVSFSVGNFQLNISAFETNINESISIILKTKNGERCFQEQFGSGLQEFFFQKMDETMKGEIIEAVFTSLLHNEPRITVNEVDVDFIDPRSGIVEISISYTYNQTNTRHNYVFPFNLNEGTNLSI